MKLTIVEINREIEDIDKIMEELGKASLRLLEQKNNLLNDRMQLLKKPVSIAVSKSMNGGG